MLITLIKHLPTWSSHVTRVLVASQVNRDVIRKKIVSRLYYVRWRHSRWARLIIHYLLCDDDGDSKVIPEVRHESLKAVNTIKLICFDCSPTFWENKVFRLVCLFSFTILTLPLQFYSWIVGQLTSSPLKVTRFFLTNISKKLNIGFLNKSPIWLKTFDFFFIILKQSCVSSNSKLE